MNPTSSFTKVSADRSLGELPLSPRLQRTGPEQQLPSNISPATTTILPNPFYDPTAIHDDQSATYNPEEMQAKMDLLLKTIQANEEELQIARAHEAQMQQQTIIFQNEIATLQLLLNEAQANQEKSEESEEPSFLDFGAITTNFFNNIFEAKK